MEQETQSNTANAENSENTQGQSTQPAQGGQAAASSTSTSAALLKNGGPPDASQDGNKAADSDKPNANSKSQGLQMPGKDATPEQWAEFYKQIGRPESPEGYDLQIPEGDSGEFAKEIAPLLHKANLTKEQAKVLGGEWNKFAQAMQAKHAQAEAQAQAQTIAKHNAEEQALKKEWASDFSANVEMAKRAAAQFFPAEHTDSILNALDHAIGPKATMQLLHNIGKRIGEDSASGISDGAKSPKSVADMLFDGK